MPKFLEDKLKREAKSKGFTGKRADKFVYGTMNDIGAMHGSQETAKGAAMEKKHEEDATKRFRGEAHEYSERRPKRKVQSRYSSGAGTAY